MAITELQGQSTKITQGARKIKHTLSHPHILKTVNILVPDASHKR